MITKDKELERKYLMQEVIDRILKYGDEYTKEILKVNEKFNISKQKSPDTYCFRYPSKQEVQNN